jgi:hypothetical protein
VLAGTRNEGKDKARGGVQGVKHLPVALESNVSERRYAWAAIRMAAGDAATLACGPVRRSSASIHFGATRAVRSNEAPLEGAAERAEQVGIRPERPPVARWTSRRASRQTGQRSSTARRRGKRSRREFSEIAAFKVQFPRRLKDQSLFGSFRSFF